MSDAEVPSQPPIKKLPISKYFGLEGEWLASQGRKRFGAWFLSKYFPKVTDDVLYKCKDTYKASMIILAKYIQS